MKKLTLIIYIIFSFAHANAVDFVGGEHAPIAGEDQKALPEMQKDHAMKLREMEMQHYHQMKLLEDRYALKIKQEEAKKDSMKGKRQYAEDLRRERMERLSQLQEEYMRRKAELAEHHIESNNHFMRTLEAKREYFRNKEKRDKMLQE